MISFHKNQLDLCVDARKYSRNWLAVDTDDVHRLSKAITNYAVSFGVFRGGHRMKDNFIKSNWIGLDFDVGVSLSSIQKTFCDHIHLLGTTKSHQVAKGNEPPCDRFRLFLKLNDTVTDVKKYESLVSHFIDRYEADEQCKDAARFFWPCKEIVSIEAEGFSVEVQEILDVEEESTSYDYSDYKAVKAIPPWVEHWLRFGVRDLTRNIHCYKSAIILSQCGYNPDEIYDIVMNSAIPISKDPKVAKEVRSAVNSGVKRAAREGITPLPFRSVVSPDI